MRILFDARTLDDHFPGIGRYTYHLVHALARREELSLTLVVNPHARTTRFPPLAETLPHVPQISLPYSPLAPTAQWAALTRLRDARAHDLYHTPYYVFPYLLSRALPTVVTLHDAIPSRFPHYFPPHKRLLIRMLKRLAIRRARHLITDSHTTAEDMVRYHAAPPERITVAHLAPAPQFRPPTAEERARVREQYQLPDRFLIYVGSDKPHKNVGLLLRVWRVLERRTAPALPPTLVLVGPMRHLAQSSLPTATRVLGFVPEEDLPTLYGTAWACLVPSLYEGFGLPVVEAMACGTPVLCSDIPPLAEVAGDAAWRLPPRDAQAWADAILTLWESTHSRDRWRERALQRAPHFTWGHTAARVIQAYRKAIATT